MSTNINVRLRPFCESSVEGQNIERPARINKTFRYALLTGDTPDTVTRTILDTFNSYENRYGEYIKVLIGSRVSRVGINLANVLNVFIVNPSWNQSNTYQAISRAIRATSHVSLIEEKRLLLLTLDDGLKERLMSLNDNQRNELLSFYISDNLRQQLIQLNDDQRNQLLLLNEELLLQLPQEEQNELISLNSDSFNNNN